MKQTHEPKMKPVLVPLHVGVVEKKVSVVSKPKGAAAAKSLISKKQSEDDAQAAFVIQPSTSAAITLDLFLKDCGELDLGSLMLGLNKSIEKVQAGDLKECEGMLLGQAHSLQAIFMYMSQRAVNQKVMHNYEGFMRLALKAQSQCRATLETLAALKNPPVMFTRQANIANGPQQVNNCVGSPSPRVEKCEKQKNKLLELEDVERVDP